MINLKQMVDTAFLDDLKLRTTKKGRKAMSRAINDALKRGSATITGSKEGVSRYYNVKKSDVKSNERITLTSESTLTKGTIKYASRRLTVGTSTHFSITPSAYKSQKGKKVRSRRKATATIKRGSKKQMGSAFIANPSAIKGGNTMLWIRENGGRGIAPIKTVSIPQMVENNNVYEAAQRRMKEYFEERFEKYMDMKG